MPNAKTKIIVSMTLIVLLLISFFYFIEPVEDSAFEHVYGATVDEPQKNTIATQWQWGTLQKANTHSVNNIDTSTERPFTAESVYIALQAVKIDSDGNIILDHDALISLDEALERIHNRLNRDSLAELQTLIKRYLPSTAGEQTADMVERYYHFLEAKEEFSRINEAMADTNNENSIQAIETNELLYSELKSLRERYLGYEATNSLFRVSDANAKYMFDSMKLALDDQLTLEQRIQERKKIEAHHLEQSINIINWPARFKNFQSKKQHIISSSITDEDKQHQLTELLAQHFDTDERKRIEYLGLDEL